MSAAATAAGYLYASGRLRGRKDGEEPESRDDKRHEDRPAQQAVPRRKPLRVAALPPEEFEPSKPLARTKPAVRIEYRTRRWRPGGSVD